MIRVLVTGGKGQLARCIKDKASAYPDLELHFADRHELDITQAADVSSYLESQHWDYCINTAAYTQVDEAERNPEKAFAVNAIGVKNLAIACRNSEVILIHLSTDYVFDGKKKLGYTPDDKTNPINVYGASKLAGETYIHAHLERYLIVRTSWLYSDYPPNFYLSIRRKLERGEAIRVVDNQRGAPTHAADLADYLLDWIGKEDRTYGIHHFTGPEVMSWYEFAKKIALDMGVHPTKRIIRDNNYTSFAERPANSILLE